MEADALQCQRCRHSLRCHGSFCVRHQALPPSSPRGAHLVVTLSIQCGRRQAASTSPCVAVDLSLSSVRVIVSRVSTRRAACSSYKWKHHDNSITVDSQPSEPIPSDPDFGTQARARRKEPARSWDCGANWLGSRPDQDAHKVFYTDYIEQRGFHGVHEFLYSFIRTLAKRREASSQ